MNLADRDLLREVCYIDGQWLAADSGQRIAVTNPATGEVLGHVPRMGADETRRAITAEQGKPLAESRGEIAFAAAYVEFYAEEGKRIYGDVIPSPNGDRRLIVTKEPRRR